MLITYPLYSKRIDQLMADCRALQIVLSFFHADGAGLPVERLQLGLYRVSSNHGLLSVWREVFSCYFSLVFSCGICFFQECLVLMNTCLFYLRQNKGLRPFVHIVVVQKALVPGEIAVTIFIYMEST